MDKQDLSLIDRLRISTKFRSIWSLVMIGLFAILLSFDYSTFDDSLVMPMFFGIIALIIIVFIFGYIVAFQYRFSKKQLNQLEVLRANVEKHENVKDVKILMSVSTSTSILSSKVQNLTLLFTKENIYIAATVKNMIDQPLVIIGEEFLRDAKIKISKNKVYVKVMGEYKKSLLPLVVKRQKCVRLEHVIDNNLDAFEELSALLSKFSK